MTTFQDGTKISPDLPICTACGTQYSSPVTTCRICDDPRQFVPPSGQSFTTLAKAQASGYSLTFTPEPHCPNIIAIRIEPPTLGIGQRAFLIITPHGNIIWDLVCYLDNKAVSKINEYGGVICIIISHPHFYTTWVDWAETFSCLVFLAGLDKSWLNRQSDRVNFLDGSTEIMSGVNALVCGGHFPGSMCLHIKDGVLGDDGGHLFHADTIHTVPNAHSPGAGAIMKLQGQTSFTFMWSIPNMIPLAPMDILGIWKALKRYRFRATYGFNTVKWEEGMELQERVLESMKRFVKASGFEEGSVFNGMEILNESAA